mmetsp:Transcript_2118/g.6024  ORF Transcript_2118/g.6024 Transcript_2118/m.6024 type:complete len:226 (+) Transcript_2118:301-978(+)
MELLLSPRRTRGLLRSKRQRLTSASNPTADHEERARRGLLEGGRCRWRIHSCRSRRWFGRKCRHQKCRHRAGSRKQGQAVRRPGAAASAAVPQRSMGWPPSTRSAGRRCGRIYRRVAMVRRRRIGHRSSNGRTRSRGNQRRRLSLLVPGASTSEPAPHLRSSVCSRGVDRGCGRTSCGLKTIGHPRIRGHSSNGGNRSGERRRLVSMRVLGASTFGPTPFSKAFR